MADKVTLVLTNMYNAEDGMPDTLVVSSVQGIFSSEEKAMQVWNDTLAKLGITNVKAFQPTKNLLWRELLTGTYR